MATLRGSIRAWRWRSVSLTNASPGSRFPRAEAKEVFSPAEIVEMTRLASFYVMIARFLTTLAIDFDGAPINWSQSDWVNERAYASRMLARSA